VVAGFFVFGSVVVNAKVRRPDLEEFRMSQF
jgi:hypothetical protein